MQKRLFKVLLAFMLIMTMTMSNFCFNRYKCSVSAVEEITQDKKY